MSGKTTERGKETEDGARRLSRRDVLKASGTAVAIGTGVNAVTGSAMADHCHGPGADPEIEFVGAHRAALDIEVDWSVTDDNHDLKQAVSELHDPFHNRLDYETTSISGSSTFGIHSYDALLNSDAHHARFIAYDEKGNSVEERNIEIELHEIG